MLIRPRRPAGLIGVDGALAALEFALIAPIMGLLFVAVLDIVKGMILQAEMYNAAHAIAVAASIEAVQPDKSTTLSPTAAQNAMSSIWAEVPWFRSGVATGYTVVSLTSVVFTPTSPLCSPALTTCKYTPNVAWTANYLGGVSNGATQTGRFDSSNSRQCGPQIAVTPDTPIGAFSDFSELKTYSINNPDPVVIADIVYQYSFYLPPIVSSIFPSNLFFEETVMWPVRSVSPNATGATPTVAAYTTYNLTNLPDGGAGKKCLGYD